MCETRLAVCHVVKPLSSPGRELVIGPLTYVSVDLSLSDNDNGFSFAVVFEATVLVCGGFVLAGFEAADWRLPREEGGDADAPERVIDEALVLLPDVDGGFLSVIVGCLRGES